MSNKDLLKAAASRFLAIAFGAAVMPVLHPGLGGMLPIVIGYLVSGAVLQWLIFQGRGGVLRPVVAGILDVLFVTAVVHAVGSVTTVMVGLYFFATIAHTLISGSRMGVALTVFAAVAYTIVVLLAAKGVIAYAPHAPAGLLAAPPTVLQGILAASILTAMLIITTAIVGMLVTTNQQREDALVDANARLETLSSRDPLTSLLNRRALVDRLNLEVDALVAQRPLVVAVLDLDRFKLINDERGHAEGDALLVLIANAIQESARDTDVVARLGGDEFVVLYRRAVMEDARVGAERLVAAVENVGREFDPQRPVTVSLGLAASVAGDTANKLLQRADEAAYRAKREGGNRVVVCES